MSTKLQEFKVLIPITAQNFDTEVLEVQNLFRFPEKKQQLLTLCTAAKVAPLDITSDSIKFRRRDIKSVIAFMEQLGLRPVLTKEAETTSLKQLAEALNVMADYNGTINLNLATTNGDVNLSTTIEVHNLDETDAAKLMRIIKTAATMFSKPMDVTLVNPAPEGPIPPNEALVPYVAPEQVESFRKNLIAAMEKVGYFKEYAISMDNLPKLIGKEVGKVYATTLKVKFPDGRVSKVELTPVQPTVVANGDVFVGPHPKFLPLHAGIVKYTVIEATPSTVSFMMSHKNQNISAQAYKLTRDQFEDISDLYHIKKQSATALNVQKKEFIKNERDQHMLETLKGKGKSLNLPEKLMLENLIKDKEHQVLPDQTKMGENISKDGASAPPHSLPELHVSGSAKPVASGKLFQALGLW